MIQQYVYFNKHAEWIIEDMSDPKQLFRAAFEQYPYGEVRVGRGLASVHFYCQDPRDVLVVDGAPRSLEGDYEDREDDFGIPDITGVKLNWEIDGLPVKVTASDCSVADDDARRTFIHEQQHVLMSLFEEGFPADFYHPEELAGSIYSLDKEELSVFLDRVIRRFMKDSYLVGQRVKDEILAYTKEGEDTESILDRLLKEERDGGIYDYLAPYFKDTDLLIRDLFGSDFELTDEYKELIRVSSERIFCDEYQSFLEMSLEVVDGLRGYYTDEQIVAILMTEPISRWPKLFKILSSVNFRFSDDPLSEIRESVNLDDRPLTRPLISD